MTFLSPEDEVLFKKYAAPAFQVQVGLHELLGHGSGKLLEENDAGAFNFDRQQLCLPNFETGESSNEAVKTWYKPGETWESKFPAIGSSYEECRAESVGIYLCTDREGLSIFGHETEEEANNIIYINWLMMARAGLTALEFYRPSAKTWGQAHMMARFAILQVMLEIGQDFVTIEKTTEPEGLIVRLDREKILSHGKPAVGKFLLKLQVYKATANFEEGKKMYDHYTSVSEKFLEYRELVLKLKKPRRIIVQPELILSSDGSNVEIRDDFSPDASGMIASFQERFQSQDTELYELWKNSGPAFRS